MVRVLVLVYMKLTLVVNAPHHFLKADERMQEEAKSRDWIMARITSSEEAVAGEARLHFDRWTYS